MKLRRLVLITGVMVGVAAVVSCLLVSHWQRSDQTFRILPKLATAEQNYERELISQGRQVPASVTLRDLVSSGYVSPGEIRSLDGADVTFYPTVTDAFPQAILVRVRMPDGVEIAAMSDGSVQSLPHRPKK